MKKEVYCATVVAQPLRELAGSLRSALPSDGDGGGADRDVKKCDEENSVLKTAVEKDSAGELLRTAPAAVAAASLAWEEESGKKEISDGAERSHRSRSSGIGQRLRRRCPFTGGCPGERGEGEDEEEREKKSCENIGGRSEDEDVESSDANQ